MSRLEVPASRQSSSLLEGIVEQNVNGLPVLAPADRRPFRRVLYVNSYGGAAILERVKKGQAPSHHLWGCPQLARMGYEVGLAEPLPDFYFNRHALPHDLKLLKMVRSWLGPDGIVYCGHNVLYWLPFLRALGLVRCRIVSLLFAREPLNLGRGHAGIIALTPAAAEQAKKLAPRTTIAHLCWGADLSIYPKLPYTPEWFLSCGITQRDHLTLNRAASRCRSFIRIISPNLPPGLTWPPNVELVTGGKHDDTVSYQKLLRDYYARCAASLVILKYDPVEYTGVGTTNLIEAMAMARPVIVTRTGALPTQIDVEQAGCGLHVPPEDPEALAQAITTLAEDPARAQAMGECGRLLAERYYNITRYANELHQFFESLG